MKFSKRVNFFLLSFLLTLNIALRYPVVQHELGADSFLIHILSNSITHHHYGKWILHPLSYIGLYPFSYPSAYPYLAASVSSSTGIDVESSIFTISIAIGLIGVFGIYFLAREIKNDDLFCFIAALAFSLSPLFIRTTFWQASTRNLFMSLAPACVLLLVKTRGFAINRLNFLFIITLLTVGTSHRLGVFMIFILIAYLTAVILFALYKQIVPYISKTKRIKWGSRIFGSLIIVGIFLILLSMLISGNNPLQGAKGLSIYEESQLFSGSSPQILILNLFVSLIGRIGFMLVFGLLGLIFLIWKKNKGLYDVFIIVALIFLFPTIGMRTYYAYFFLIFFSLLAGFAFLYFYRIFERKKAITFMIVIAALVASIGFVGFMFDNWSVSKGDMPEPVYDTGIYVKYNTNNTFISNDGLIAARVGSISEKSCLPIGGATLHRTGPEQLVYDFLHEEDYNIVPIPVQEITVGSDALYQPKGAGNVVRDWATIQQTPCDEVTGNYILKYRLQYSLASKARERGFYAYARTYYSNFQWTLNAERYKIYDNGVLEIHYFEYV